eukprot:gnl/Hemi2/13018_TR4446_c0_g1_i1.p1 gnl/Hemi2/13018_TR4446_c0_g1~~gnl/Hemi2/13018_TR4446_c0_g1_i1.p1  ORF type:complete len:332 (-),score=99.12 gnl/Hemi2/13018_TR4446_c0_g1_i1:153-1148(-)
MVYHRALLVLFFCCAILAGRAGADIFSTVALHVRSNAAAGADLLSAVASVLSNGASATAPRAGADGNTTDCSAIPRLCNSDKTGCLPAEFSGPECRHFNGDLSLSNKPFIVVRSTLAPSYVMADRNAASLDGDSGYWQAKSQIAFHAVCVIQTFGDYELCNGGKCSGGGNPYVGREGAGTAGTPPTQQYWYSFPKNAMCEDSSTFGDNCAWYQAGLLKVVSGACLIKLQNPTAALKFNNDSGGCDNIAADSVQLMSLEDMDNFQCASQVSASANRGLGKFSGVMGLVVVMAVVAVAALAIAAVAVYRAKAQSQEEKRVVGGYVFMPNESQV